MGIQEKVVNILPAGHLYESTNCLNSHAKIPADSSIYKKTKSFSIEQTILLEVQCYLGMVIIMELFT